MPPSLPEDTAWIAIFVKLRAQAKSSKFQTPKKLQAQKPTCAPFVPASVFGVLGLRFGTSLEFGGLLLGVSLGGGLKLFASAFIRVYVWPDFDEHRSFASEGFGLLRRAAVHALRTVPADLSDLRRHQTRA